jgi:ATP-dependent RNA helicase DHX57
VVAQRRMVNKPHAPRQGNKGKKPGNTAATANGEDTSFIVFGNDKGGKKGKQPASAANNAPAAGSRKGKGATAANGAAPQPEAEKKPDTRTLIAGSSWTGKLPMTLFNEHCQKQHWEKCEYTVHRTPKGFTGAVIIRQKNPKTGEITALPPIHPPKTYFESGKGVQESAVEARHFAAAYALYRVGNTKNLSMALPPQYRDLWKGDFAELKKGAVEQGLGYLYEADPFLAVRQRQEEQAKKEKERAVKTKKRQETEEQQGVVSLDGSVKRLDRGWTKAPKVEMGIKTRRDVEDLVRKEGVWNPPDVRISDSERKRIVQKLSTYGFRPSHVEEAVDICKNEEETMEWLLIHLPEDDVPSWALPENYLAGVALASSDVQRENRIKRLAAAGYSRDLCADMLDACNGDESKSAFVLQHKLLGDESQSVDGSSANEVWEEEQATLEAIYGERYSTSNGACCIQLELKTPSGEAITLRARPPPAYPYDLPAMAVEAPLPAYIKLSILRQCLLHAKENLIGEMMLFNVIDWLEQNIPDIIERPDKLKELTGATSSVPERPAQESFTRRQKTRRHPKALSWTPNTPASQKAKSAWEARQSTPEQQKMMHARRNLPAWQLRVSIVASVMANQVTIISGETGSGKSTQSVQFVLDDLINQGYGEQANIICTQPRRISALGLADRVADERCGKVGDEVGYTIRGESKQRAGVTKITFVTTGVLLRRLQTSGGSADDVVKSLADVSHVVIDEVHERSLDTDFLLALLRDVLKARQDLKLILMSATLDAAVFEAYFKEFSSVGKVEIAGRTYPVHDIYMDEIVRLTGYGDYTDDAEDDVDFDLAGDFSVAGGRRPNARPNRPQRPRVAAGHDGHFIDYELIARTVQHIDGELGDADGGILVFLPGTMEIDQTLRALRSMPHIHALPLHAGLQSVEQKRVFARPPKGMRKVVAATNVAETSITIEDIVAVIDTGRVKETSFDPANNMVRLMEQWASKAACKQRRGRAGRVRAGKCYKLYTRKQEENMADRPEPEIRRVPLEQLCLSVKAMGVNDVPAFLASALTPPESLSVTGALTLLGRIGALDQNELTALGRHLSMIPADLRCSKLMVYGAAFGCLDASLTIAATLTVKSPFFSPQTKRDESKAAKAAFSPGNGDLLCDLRAFEEWSRRRSKGEPTGSLRRWCDENFLNHQTLMDIATTRSQYVSSLQEIGFLKPGHGTMTESLNRHNESDALLRTLIAGSFQPQLARIDFPEKKYFASAAGTVAQDPEAHMIKYFNEENGRVFVHPSSTLFDAQGFAGNSMFMSYFTKMATSKVFIRDLTPFNVYSLLMFAGSIEIDPQGRGLLVDGWIRLRGWARIGVLVSRLRMILDDLLARKVDEPGLEMSETDIVKLVGRMVTFDGLDR